MFMRHERQLGMREGRVAIARNLLAMNLPLDQIVKATDLNLEEIESLDN